MAVNEQYFPAHGHLESGDKTARATLHPCRAHSGRAHTAHEPPPPPPPPVHARRRVGTDLCSRPRTNTSRPAVHAPARRVGGRAAGGAGVFKRAIATRWTATIAAAAVAGRTCGEHSPHLVGQALEPARAAVHARVGGALGLTVGGQKRDVVDREGVLGNRKRVGGDHRKRVYLIECSGSRVQGCGGRVAWGAQRAGHCHQYDDPRVHRGPRPADREGPNPARSTRTVRGLAVHRCARAARPRIPRSLRLTAHGRRELTGRRTLAGYWYSTLRRP